MIDVYKAEDIIKDLTNKDIEVLKDIQKGLPVTEVSHNRFHKLQEHGLVAFFQYESVHSNHSITGLRTSEDGDKILNTLEQAPHLVVKDVTEVVDGEAIKTKTVEVKNPSVPAQPVVQQEKNSLKPSDFNPKDNVNVADRKPVNK